VPRVKDHGHLSRNATSLTLSRTIRLSDNDRATGEIAKLGDEGVIFLEINF